MYDLDERSEISDLPTTSSEGTPQDGDSTLHLKVAKGSTALVIEDSSVWKLNSNDEWVELG